MVSDPGNIFVLYRNTRFSGGAFLVTACAVVDGVGDKNSGAALHEEGPLV